MVLFEAWVYNKRAAHPSDIYIDKVYVINWLIEHNNYKNYLEIGTRYNDCFSKIKIDKKVGVDPTSGGTLRMTSDAYFAKPEYVEDKFDIIFIDGLHYSVQVLKDVENSLSRLNDGGIIVLHDCHPLQYKSAVYPYAPNVGEANGDCYKAIWQLLSNRFDLDVRVLGCDFGLGFVQKQNNTISQSTQSITKFQPFGKQDVQLYNEYIANILPVLKNTWNQLVPWLPSKTMDRSQTKLTTSANIVPYATAVIPL